MLPPRGTFRYRLTGLVFLAILAAIIGPLLFDGEGLPAPVPPELPGVPAVAFEEIEARRSTLETEVLHPAPALEQLDEVEQQANSLRVLVDDAQFASQTPEAVRPAEPALTTLTKDTKVFAVQVGSFADEQNAERLNHRLRNGGYEAFSTSVRVNDRTLTRVAVGPYLSRVQAEEDRHVIEERFALEAKLMGMLL